MNKNLISLNPVLRFKKIRKAQLGMSLLGSIRKPGGPWSYKSKVTPEEWEEIRRAFEGYGSISSDEFKNFDPSNTKDILTALNLISAYSHIQPGSDALLTPYDNADTILVDNKWGQQTLDAYNRVLSFARNINEARANAAKVFSMNNEKVVANTTPLKVEIAPLSVENIQPLPVTLNVSRKNTRDYIRSKGYNPYSFSALERREVRNRLNDGLGTAFTRPYNRRYVRLYLRNLGINPYSMSGRERRELRNELNNNF